MKNNPIVHKLAVPVAALALTGSLLPALFAQGPRNHPKLEGTIKATVATDLAPVFRRQTQLIAERRSSWLAHAEQATPKLFRTPQPPVAVVKVEKDATGFQGWKTVVSDKPESVLNRPLAPGDSFILDFGEHLTGQFVLTLRRFDIPVDAPVRLAFIFGEVPAEVAEPFDPYTGGLTRAWLQDEVVNFDDVPQTVTLPRRYAFRYVARVRSNGRNRRAATTAFSITPRCSRRQCSNTSKPAATGQRRRICGRWW